MKIFLTYSRPNQDVVRVLVKDLEDFGHDVWYDQELSGGQSWWNKILAAIRECEVYIFALSRDALDSTPCMREMKYAEALQKIPLPLQVEPGISMAIVPRYLSNVQVIDYTRPDDKSSMKSLHRALANLPKSPSLPEPLPEPPPVPISYLDTLKEKIDAPTLEKQDQVSILSDLKKKLYDEQVKKDDVIVLLRKFRAHDDLYAFVASEVDTMLQEASKSNGVNPSVQQGTKTAPQRPVVQPAQNQPVYQPNQFKPIYNANTAGTVAASSTQWSVLAMLLLGFFTLFIPLVGIIAGIVALVSSSNKFQGIILLVEGIFLSIVYLIIFNLGSY